MTSRAEGWTDARMSAVYLAAHNRGRHSHRLRNYVHDPGDVADFIGDAFVWFVERKTYAETITPKEPRKPRRRPQLRTYSPVEIAAFKIVGRAIWTARDARRKGGRHGPNEPNPKHIQIKDSHWQTNLTPEDALMAFQEIRHVNDDFRPKTKSWGSIHESVFCQ